MLGNDIIDIVEARRSSNWERLGFMQKIFTTAEQSTIKASADPFTSVWRLWSMKESAYKVFIQAGGERFFNPTKIECHIISEENGLAKIGSRTLSTITSINANYLFSTAVVGASAIYSHIIELSGVTRKKKSRFLYEQLLSDFARRHALYRKDLRLKKASTGVPRLHYKSTALDIPISITHHGEYGAYSLGD